VGPLVSSPLLPFLDQLYALPFPCSSRRESKKRIARTPSLPLRTISSPFPPLRKAKSRSFRSQIDLFPSFRKVGPPSDSFCTFSRSTIGRRLLFLVLLGEVILFLFLSQFQSTLFWRGAPRFLLPFPSLQWARARTPSLQLLIFPLFCCRSLWYSEFSFLPPSSPPPGPISPHLGPSFLE